MMEKKNNVKATIMFLYNIQKNDYYIDFEKVNLFICMIV